MKISGQSQIVFDIDENLPENLKNKAILLLNKNQDVFALNYKELGLCNTHAVHLDTVEHQPIYSHPYHCSQKVLPLLKDEISQLLGANRIRESRSQYGSPAFFVPKADGGVRLVINYKKINKIIKKYHFPIKKIDDILAQLANKTMVFHTRHEIRVLAASNAH
jgi:hypothetical protein